VKTFALALAALILGLGAIAPARAGGPPRIKLGGFTTSYANDAEHKSRAFNVELAAEAVDGKSIAPGATFSFNDAVGERTAAFGYVKSVVLRDGMIAEGTGGGTCQVASTLHAAALLAGLDVVLRAPHTRPSAYIRMGLDATVAFPTIDLKLKNPTPSAVLVHARAARGVLDVWVDVATGAAPSVSVTSEIVERLPFPRVLERDKSIVDDSVHLKAFGIPGYRVRRTREIRLSDGSLRRDVRVDVYPPTSQILRVAPALDEARLTATPSESADEAEAMPELTQGQGVRPVTWSTDPGVLRPALVQLRPSTMVSLDNGH
jgi:hypothetical protein